MKKSIIAAGAASVALAAMPIVGVFADDVTSQVDTLDVTITNTCTIASVTHAGTGAWTTNTLAKDVVAGELNNGIGTSTFNIKCNNQTGWTVTAAAQPLTGKITTTQNIPVGTPAVNTPAWQYVSSTSDADVTAASTNTSPVASSAKTTGNDGKEFTMTYNVSTDTALSAQTYEGTITYTLAANQ